ncbi:hypothetical protein [Massilia sp. CF038]|uniref:hypothetical protein n=1 Tax=Massilia sp. CF038 TaxID=1881045 RepID=UPI000921946D|nr:hypothetical protein [Massilia sp. CF038]SHG74570.1 hypothetical protein SAMN05428948_1861 [Massilia sp. CF038]
MPRFCRLLFPVLLLAVSASTFAADPYSVAIGEPLVGSILPRGRVTLGIPVNIDKSWDGLASADRSAWRAFTEMDDPEVTPPFPLPHIRGFLSKLNTYDFPMGTESVTRDDRIFLVVRVAETGAVSQVETMDASADGKQGLSDYEKVLAARYSLALLATKFSPALYKGQPAPSAFVMRVNQTTSLK